MREREEKEYIELGVRPGIDELETGVDTCRTSYFIYSRDHRYNVRIFGNEMAKQRVKECGVAQGEDETIAP